MTAPPNIPRAPGGCQSGFVLRYRFVSISSSARESSTRLLGVEVIGEGAAENKWDREATKTKGGTKNVDVWTMGRG